MSSPIERRLAERLGVSEDDARSALAALAHDVQRRLAERGHAEIDGVGALEHDDHGVTFELDPSLVDAVQERTAGPGAVAVAGPGARPFVLPREEAPTTEAAVPAPETTTEATTPDAETTEFIEDAGQDVTPADALEEPSARETMPTEAAEPDAFAIDEPADEPATETGEEVSEAELEEPTVEPQTTPREPVENVLPVEAAPADGDEDPVDDVATTSAADHETVPVEEEVDEEAEPDVDPGRSADANEAVAAIAAAESAEEAAAWPPRSPEHGGDREPIGAENEPTERSPALLWAVVAVIVLVLVGGGYIVYRAMQGTGEPEPTVTQTEPLGPQVEPTPDEDGAAPDEGAGDEAPADPSGAAEPTTEEPATEPAPAAPNEPEPEEPEEGLDPEQGGWTIVVASRTSQAAADDVLQEYRAAITDYPVGVFSGTTGGVTRYRIGVGQFATRSEALQAIESLEGQLPADAWASPLTTDT